MKNETPPLFSSRNTIGLRLLRYIFGCYLVVTIIVTIVQLSSEYIHEQKSVFREMVALEHTFNESLSKAIWSFDNSHLVSILNGMSNIDVVSGIKITDHDETVLSSVGVIAENLGPTDAEQYSPQDNIRSATIKDKNTTIELFEYRFPIEYTSEVNNQPELVGYGHIYTKNSAVVDRVKYSFLLIIVNSVIKTAALWIIFFVVTRRLIARPLNALSTACNALNPKLQNDTDNENELNEILKSDQRDEIHSLAASFKTMHEAIMDKIKIIEEQKSVLEFRVEERTQELEDLNAEYKKLALHDALTGLPNRLLFRDRLNHSLKTASRTKTEFGLLCVDLRRFKYVNDTYGHQFGDTLLKEVADRLSRVLRKSDTLARMGGDEFSLILPSLNQENWKPVVEKLLEAFKDPILFDNNSIPIVANVGVALYPQHATESEVLFRYADTAMYSAKRAEERFRLFQLDMEMCEKTDNVQFIQGS